MSDLLPSDRAPQLLVAPGVVIPDDAVIGANVVLRAGVVLGRGVVVEDFALLGKLPALAAGSASPPAHHAPTLVGDGAIIGSHTVVNAGAVIGSGAYLGDHCGMREGARLGADASLGRGSAIGRDAVVGDRARTQAFCGLAARVVVEDDCFLGGAVLMMAGLTMSQRDVEPSPSALRRGARVGSGAQILTGVEVGQEAVVGAGSVVTRDVPPGVTVAGVPARPLTRG
jgi:UDP-2-acetamido-3-amino-2,3-dideoxy-glucuronate N-acetyltransferase